MTASPPITRTTYGLVWVAEQGLSAHGPADLSPATRHQRVVVFNPFFGVLRGHPPIPSGRRTCDAAPAAVPSSRHVAFSLLSAVLCRRRRGVVAPAARRARSWDGACRRAPRSPCSAIRRDEHLWPRRLARASSPTSAIPLLVASGVYGIATRAAGPGEPVPCALFVSPRSNWTGSHDIQRCAGGAVSASRLTFGGLRRRLARKGLLAGRRQLVAAGGSVPHSPSALTRVPSCPTAVLGQHCAWLGARRSRGPPRLPQYPEGPCSIRFRYVLELSTTPGALRTGRAVWLSRPWPSVVAGRSYAWRIAGRLAPAGTWPNGRALDRRRS
jgi:hypothetical protein